MKKPLLFIAVVLGLGTFINLSGQHDATVEMCPQVDYNKPNELNTKALWDIEFNYNATTTTGDVGMAGACFHNNEYWVSRWASDTMYRFSSTGVLISEFVVAGLTGTRALTSDGTYLYASTNSNSIFRIDPGTQTLSGPPITVAGSVTARFCTYDSTLSSGAGGFWIGNFGTDIEAIDMSGNILTTILAATHGLTGMYGAAIDNISAGGPYLWIFDQSGTNTTQLRQLQLPGGTPTVLTHDVFTDVGAAHSLTSGLAGGLFITTDVTPGLITIGGIVQGTPSNLLFGYELGAVSTASVNNETFSNVTVYPNPSNGVFFIDGLNEGSIQYEVMDVSGKVLKTGYVSGAQANIDLTTFASGTYMVQFVQSGIKLGQKQIVKN